MGMTNTQTSCPALTDGLNAVTSAFGVPHVCTDLCPVSPETETDQQVADRIVQNMMTRSPRVVL